MPFTVMLSIVSEAIVICFSELFRIVLLLQAVVNLLLIRISLLGPVLTFFVCGQLLV